MNFIALPWLLLPPLQGLLEESRVAQVDTKTLSTVPVVSLQKHLENMVSAVPLCALRGFSGQVDRQENLQNTEIYNMVYLLASALVYSKERLQRKQN